MYYKILPELKNAVRARKERATFPYSNMDFAILKKLMEGGYLKSVEKEMMGRRSVISVKLAYKDKVPAMNDFKLTSKPSRHVYADYRGLNLVRQGHGLSMLSTSKGIMTGREARKNKIGGEYLFEIW